MGTLEKGMPFKRDYLKEAYEIARGDKRRKLKVEHVQATISALSQVCRDVENLKKVMGLAYQEACRRRTENGLPLPPKPPALETTVKLPWETQ